MATGLVDWAALGVPLLDQVFGPTPAISTNPAQRTPHENFIIQHAVQQAQRVVDNPNDLALFNRWHQYGGQGTLYRLWYSTGQTIPVLKQAADRCIEVFRDALLGFEPLWYDIPFNTNYVLGNPAQNPQSTMLNPFGNPNGESWAAYAIINPALEAASPRKTRDIVKILAAGYMQFDNHELREGGAGAREGGVGLMWGFLAKIIWGGSATIQTLSKPSFTVQTVTMDYIFNAMLDNIMNHDHEHTGGTRAFFGWDFGTPDPGDQRYIGNENLAGTAAKALVKIDRYLKMQGTPDSRIYTHLKRYYDWLDFGVLPDGTDLTSNPTSAIQTGGSMWIPGVGPYEVEFVRYRGGWRYYFVFNSNLYGTLRFNGVHTETLTCLAGHVLSAMAWGSKEDTDPTARTRYLSRVTDAKEGLIRFVQDVHPTIIHDAREWTEMMDTWQMAEGIINDSGPIIPPVQDMVVDDTTPVINQILTVTITGGPGNTLDWVAIAPVGSSLETYLPTWKYLANNSQAVPSSGVVNGVVTLQAPPSADTYEVRFLFNDGYTLVPGFVPVPIVVSGGGAGPQYVLNVDGAPDQLYTVLLTVNPQDELFPRWFVNNQPYPPVPVGALTKPSTKRYFVDGNGKAVYLTGSHNWNDVSEWGSPPTTPGNPPSVFDFNAYLTRLIDEGHTATRLWVLGDFVHYNTGPGFRNKFPWARSGTPGAADGGNKWNLLQYDNGYLSVLRDRVLLCQQAGITAIVTMFNGFDSIGNTTGKNIWHASENITVDGDPNHDGLTREAYTLTTIPPTLLSAQKSYMHQLVDTLNDVDRLVWEIVNEPSGAADTWVQHMVADLRAYEASKPQQHGILQGFYAHDGTGSTNTQLWNLAVEGVAPGSLAKGGASPDGTGDYETDPPASTGAKVVFLDTDHIFGVGGDRDLIWRAFVRGLNPIYMDTMLDTDYFSPPTPAPQYQRSRDAMGLTAQLARRLRTDLNTMTPQGQGTATPVNTGLALYTTPNDPTGPAAIQGWGATTVGGTGQPDVHVTTSANSGAGSLRTALAAGNRNIVFDVDTVTLTSQITAGGNNWTLDGSTAPSGAVTINGWGINIIDHSQIIIKQVRIRNAGAPNDGAADGISLVGPGTHHVVIERCSITGATDGTIDINGGCQDITVQYCLLSGIRTMLIGQSGTPDPQTERVTLYRNLWIGGNNNEVFTRYPLVRANNYVPTDMTADIQENVFHGWLRANGMEIENTGRVNVIRNLFIPSPTTTLDQREDSVKVATASLAHFAGNVEYHSAPIVNYNSGYGTKATPWTAPALTAAADAMTAAQIVVANAGVVPRDATDTALLARLPITGVFDTEATASEYVVYRVAGGPSPVTVDLGAVPSDLTLNYVWLHPVSGVVGGSGSVLGGAVRNFTPPDSNDWVLFIRRLDLPYSLFGFNGVTPIPGNLGAGTFVVRADIYEVTGESLLAQREVTIVNGAPGPNGIITHPPPGYQFQPDTPIHDSLDFLVVQPSTAGVEGAQFKITPAVGGATLLVGSEITVPESDGTFRHDPFVHAGVYADGVYDITCTLRIGVTTADTPAVRVSINNSIGQPGGTRQGRRLRGRLP